IIYAPYGQFPIMFHTNRRCAGMLKAPSRSRPGWDQLPDHLFDPNAADWLVVRPAWRPLEGYDAVIRRWQGRARRAGRHLTSDSLSVKDITWGNRPVLRYHYFQSPGPSRTRNITLIHMQRADRRGRAKTAVTRPNRPRITGRRP
ncbi:unnamed protein product, partial [marine sediment metagenome]